MGLRLVAFDLDSTLLDLEGIDALAKCVGHEREVAQVTKTAMEGGIPFKESLLQRVRYLKGLSHADYVKCAHAAPLVDGASLLFTWLHQEKIQTCILSGGFEEFAKAAQKRLGTDQFFANRLQFLDGVCTGEVIPPILDADGKSSALKKYAESQGIKLNEVAAVGDGANDIQMLQTAAVGIAFHPKPALARLSKYVVSEKNLTNLIPLLRDFETLC